MAERVVYLHAGLHKTATSSLQATCKANRAALLAQGVCYPLFHCVENGRRGIDNHSIPLRTAFNAAGRPYHISTLWRLQDLPSVSTAYRHTLEQVLAEHDRVLLSGEDVSAMALEDLREMLEGNFVTDDKGRWSVPDPKKAEDLDQLRTRALLREFDGYKDGLGPLIRFRTEAARAGFKAAWAAKDYVTITTVGRRLPSDVFIEDSALLHYFRNAERLAQ